MHRVFGRWTGAVPRAIGLGLWLAVAAPALAQDSATAADPGWRIDFGPYLGYYDFDPATQFEDGFLAGLRLGIHRGGWFRFEPSFDEVYTRREPQDHAARQVTLSVHGRFEPQRWRLAPTAIVGIGFVMFDDSEYPDAFSEAWDLGLGLSFRINPSWTLRGEYVARYQRMRVRHNGAAGAIVPAPELDDLWGKQASIGVSYLLPESRAGEPVDYPVEFGVYAGFWNFSSAYRYQDDAVFGLRGGVGLFEWMALQVELDQITTSNSKTDDWAQAISFAMHGLFEVGSRWRPGILAGVSFMGLDNRTAFDAISEGFDIGPSIRLKATRVGFQADVLVRYQSVRVNETDSAGAPIASSEIDYVWSYGIRAGVNIEL